MYVGCFHTHDNVPQPIMPKWDIFHTCKWKCPTKCNAPLGHFHTQLTTSLAQWLRCPPREWKILGSNPICAGIFPGSSHTSDLKIGTPVATLPGAWLYRVSAGTSWPSVSILWLGEMQSLVCNSITVWQHVQLSSQIRPEIHLHVAGTLSNQQTTNGYVSEMMPHWICPCRQQFPAVHIASLGQFHTEDYTIEVAKGPPE